MMINNSKKLFKETEIDIPELSPQESSNSPFKGIKTLANIRSEQILSALKETREEN